MGFSRVWGCPEGLTKAQWGQEESSGALWGAGSVLHPTSCSGDGRKDSRSVLGVCCRPFFPPWLCLCAPGVSRAEDAESNAKGSGMISTSNSILPSASSAPEPHGISPEVLILSSSSRLSHENAAQGSVPRSRELGMGLTPGWREGKASNSPCATPGTASPVPRAPKPGFSSTQNRIPNHGPPSRGVPQPQFPYGGVERKLILRVFPFFFLGFRARREEPWFSPRLGEVQIPADVRGNLTGRGGNASREPGRGLSAPAGEGGREESGS